MKQFLATTALAITLCVGASYAKTSKQDVVDHYATIVSANYDAALAGGYKLESAIDALLNDPNPKTLQTAKDTWIMARKPYLQTEVFRFYEGPIDHADLGVEGRMNAWPINEGFIDYVQGNVNSGIINDPQSVVSLETILGKDQVTDEADVTTGWHAIEFLLWGQDLSADSAGNRPYTDYVAGENDNNRRRTYLKLVTQQLVADLKYLENSWEANSYNYRATFTQNPAQALSHIMTALATLSGFELSAERLAVPLESSSQEDEHSCFSDTTHQDYIYNQKGIENVYFGKFETLTGASIHDMLTAKDANLAAQIKQTLSNTSAQFAAIRPPFDQVLASQQGSDLRKPAEAALASLEKQADLFIKAAKTLGINNVEILAD